jgi:hypothetical protein
LQRHQALRGWKIKNGLCTKFFGPILGPVSETIKETGNEFFRLRRTP